MGGTKAYSNLIGDDAAINSHMSEGGAIFSKGGVEFKYGTVAENGAQEGGGIAVYGGDLYLRGATISNNYASLSVSALGMSTGGTGSAATIVNSTISGNTVKAGSKYAYAVRIDAYTTKFFNSTIAYNTGGGKPGTYLTGNAGSKAGLYSSLWSSNSYSNPERFRQKARTSLIGASSHNLIRNLAASCPLNAEGS